MWSDLFYLMGSIAVISASYRLGGSVFVTNKTYSSLDPRRKMYVLKNLIKAIVLALNCPIGVYTMKKTFMDGLWKEYSSTYHMLGSTYCAADIAGLIMVQPLPISTRFHHVSVGILCLYNLTIDYAYSVFETCLVLYAMFSCFFVYSECLFSITFCLPRSEVLL